MARLRLRDQPTSGSILLTPGPGYGRCPWEFCCRVGWFRRLGDLVLIVIVVRFGVVNARQDLGDVITPVLQLLVD